MGKIFAISELPLVGARTGKILGEIGGGIMIHSWGKMCVDINPSTFPIKVLSKCQTKGFI